MSYIQEKREFIVGNPAVLEEARQALAKRPPESKEPLVIKTPVDETKIIVTNDVITDYDVNEDGFNDLLEGVSYRIGYGTKDSPYQWANFTKIYFGSADKNFEQETSYDTTIAPDLVDAGLTTGQPSISDLESSAIRMVSVGLQDEMFDRNVAAAVDSVMASGFNFIECLYFIKRIDTSRKGEVQKYIDDLENNLGKSLSFAVSVLDRQIASEPDLNYAQILKNIRRNIKSEDFVLPGLLRADTLWNDDPVDGVCDELYGELLDITQFEDEPEKQAVTLMEKVFLIEHQKEDGGLFDESENGFVAQANRYAIEQGYENYAGLKLDLAHGLNLENYIDRMKNYLKEQSPRFKATVAGLRSAVQQERPVWELNMEPLFEERRKAALKKMGLDEEPKLSIEDMLKAAKAFYKDLGWDIDASIASGELILDLFPRCKKHPKSWHESFGGGRMSVVIVNLREKNSLDDFRSGLMHELAHAYHAFYASDNAQGSFWGGVRGGKYGLKENIPTSFENVVFSKDWMDRYLSSAKGFDNPRVREVISKEHGDQFAYWRGIQAMRTLWEINLYANADKSMEERLNYWGEMGKAYFGFDDIGVPTSQVSYFNTGYVHPTYEPMYYVAYTSGADFGRELSAHMVSTVVEKDEAKKRQMLERLQLFFAQSGTVDTVEDAIEIWRGSGQ